MVRFLLNICLTALITTFTFNFAHAQYDSIPFGSNQRTYLLHLPTGYTGTDTLPLVIAMHGGFGNAFNLQNQSQLSNKANAENFIVVYPEGVKGANGVRTWNAGWCCGFASATNVDDVGFIDALIDTLMSNYSIDNNRIYATGMSNGGFMSYRLACELPGKIAAIAPVACSMSLNTCVPSRPVPVIHFHSYLDTNVPYLGGPGSGASNHYNSPLDSVMNAWAGSNTCGILNDTIVDNAQYTFTKWRNCDCSSEIHLYITQDGGHSWPGGNKTPLGDSVSTYINANDLMWSFFQQYSLNCGTIGIDENFNENKGLELFPNPASGIVQIKIPGLVQNFTVIVYNHLGEVIFEKENKKEINFLNQPAGLYYITLQAKDKIMKGRIIKTE